MIDTRHKKQSQYVDTSLDHDGYESAQQKPLGSSSTCKNRSILQKNVID